MKCVVKKDLAIKKNINMAKTCTLHKKDLSTLRSLMLNARQVEMKTSYLRYPKLVLIEEFETVIQEYKKFISNFLMLYTNDEKEFLQKIQNYCKKYPINMYVFQKVSFQFFHHIAEKYRRFQRYLEF